MNDEKDYDTWVYHALKEAKVVKFSEAKKLYKKGWRDSPNEKVLFSGVRGKWYKILIIYCNFIKKISPHWDSYKIVVVLLMIIGVVIAIIKIKD